MAGRFPQLFNDVTLGNNACPIGPTLSNMCNSSYAAAPGWDATTGFGSVNFDMLLNLMLDPTGRSLSMRELFRRCVKLTLFVLFFFA
jgi:hypothetical protein